MIRIAIWLITLCFTFNFAPLLAAEVNKAPIETSSSVQMDPMAERMYASYKSLFLAVFARTMNKTELLKGKTPHANAAVVKLNLSAIESLSIDLANGVKPKSEALAGQIYLALVGESESGTLFKALDLSEEPEVREKAAIHLTRSIRGSGRNIGEIIPTTNRDGVLEVYNSNIEVFVTLQIS